MRQYSHRYHQRPKIFKYAFIIIFVIIIIIIIIITIIIVIIIVSRLAYQAVPRRLSESKGGPDKDNNTGPRPAAAVQSRETSIIIIIFNDSKF